MVGDEGFEPATLPVTGVSCSRRAAFFTRLARTSNIRRLAAGTDLERQPIRGFPANSSIRETLSGKNWVAIGEAAAAYDPLHGEGLAAALVKGAALAGLVAGGSDLAISIGQYDAAERTTFAQYLRERRHTYARAAERFALPFWIRRSDQKEIGYLT